MPLAKYRYVPAPEPELRAAPWLASEADRAVASPVHLLQSGLAAFAEAGQQAKDDRYPGWFRLGFPLVSSAFLWSLILWGAGLFG